VARMGIDSTPLTRVEAPSVTRITGLFRPFRQQLALTAGVAVFGVGLGIVSPFLVKAMFDKALFPPGGVNHHLLVVLAIAFSVVTVLQTAAGLMVGYLTVEVGQRVAERLRTALFGSLLRLPFAQFTEQAAGEFQSRLTNDVGGVLYFLSSVSPTMISGFTTLVGVLIAMFLLSWPLAVTSLLVLPPFLLTGVVVGGRAERAMQSRQEAYARLTIAGQEGLVPTGVLQTRVFARTETIEARYAKAASEVAEASTRQWLIATGQTQITTTLFALTPAIAFLTTAFTLEHHSLPAVSAGTLAAFVALQARLYWPLTSLLQLAVSARSARALFTRIFEFIDADEDTTLVGETHRDLPRIGRLKVVDVSFSHAVGGGRTVPVLREVSLELSPGRIAALVGSSGSGKTTLAHLVAGLYRPTSGSIVVDGYEVADLAPHARAQVVGVASQDVFLFHDTVRANLAFADPSATMREIERAARFAQIHDRIAKLSAGYDTVLGENGYMLSAGERQRLALARLILQDPMIIVLDEVTSSLDRENEQLIEATVEDLVNRKKAVLVIAHRLNTIRGADDIHVMLNGEIVETGTHADLTSLQGIYHSMVTQLRLEA
jgi:ATP-binding cassette, subfamily B, bacterial